MCAPTVFYVCLYQDRGHRAAWLKVQDQGQIALDSESCFFHLQLDHTASWYLHLFVGKMLTDQGIVVKIK